MGDVGAEPFGVGLLSCLQLVYGKVDEPRLISDAVRGVEDALPFVCRGGRCEESGDEARVQQERAE